MDSYNQSDLKEIYLSLSDEQKIVLDDHVKRGKKTKWLNIWAKSKGSVLTDEELNNPEKAMDTLLDWILLDYEDNLIVDGSIRCECGRPLRHLYTVLHKPTGKQHKLGIVHFEYHTGLSPELVREITRGLQKIDLERDEILSKIKSGWRLPFNVPPEIEIPKDMTEQFRVNLPLLDRQITRLEKLIQALNENNDDNGIFDSTPPEEPDFQINYNKRIVDSKQSKCTSELIERRKYKFSEYSIIDENNMRYFQFKSANPFDGNSGRYEIISMSGRENEKFIVCLGNEDDVRLHITITPILSDNKEFLVHEYKIAF